MATKAKNDVETIQLARKDKPDVRFTGRLLAEVDSDTESRDRGRTNRGRWTRLQLWELENGTWIAAAIGCSDHTGEIDIGEIERIPTHHVVPVGEGLDERDQRVETDLLDRQRQVMDFFGWTWLAKKLADQLGWELVEEIAE